MSAIFLSVYVLFMIGMAITNKPSLEISLSILAGAALISFAIEQKRGVEK